MTEEEKELEKARLEWKMQFWEDQERIKKEAHEYSQKRIKEIEEKVRKEAEERKEKERLEEREKKVSLWVCLGIAFGIPALVLLVPGTKIEAYVGALLVLTTGVPVIPIAIGIALAIVTGHYKKKNKK